MTLYGRHSVEEIIEMTGMRKVDIQNAIVRAIREGRVPAYAATEG